MLFDKEVMFYWGRDFSTGQVHDWISRQMERYRRDRFGIWLVSDRKTNRTVGQAGVSLQNFDGEAMPSITYMLNKTHWHQGYALEAVKGIIKFSMPRFKIPKLYCLIRPENIPSLKVALSAGFILDGTTQYYGFEHIILSLSNHLPENKKSS